MWSVCMSIDSLVSGFPAILWTEANSFLMMNDDVGPCHDISLFTYESAVMNMLMVAGEIFELTKCMKIVTSVLTWVGNKFLLL